MGSTRLYGIVLSNLGQEEKQGKMKAQMDGWMGWGGMVLDDTRGT